MDQAMAVFIRNKRRSKEKRTGENKKKRTEIILESIATEPAKESRIKIGVFREAAAHEAFLNRTMPPCDRE